MKMIVATLFTMSLFLVGCVQRDPVVLEDLSRDSVRVSVDCKAEGECPELSVIRAEANRGCAFQNRIAKPVSFHCVHKNVWSCHRYSYLFACIGDGEQ